MAPADFVRARAALGSSPYLPDIQLYQAADAFALWEETERARGGGVSAPPFWAFPWAGGQALARYLLDHPRVVRGRRVLDLAAGSGLVAIAAARGRAATLSANEIDPHAAAAIRPNRHPNAGAAR